MSYAAGTVLGTGVTKMEKTVAFWCLSFPGLSSLDHSRNPGHDQPPIPWKDVIFYPSDQSVAYTFDMHTNQLGTLLEFRF